MADKFCPGCGALMLKDGNFYKCTYCPNITTADIGEDFDEIEKLSAWQALRLNDFEKAISEFESIVVKHPQDYQSLWGLALAKASIIYVSDTDKDRKVPTMSNISEDSFLQDKIVQKAISLAPSQIAESYRSQAEYIDKVRLEWLKKASKEPPYDIFISFKDSDENGARTTDSTEMQDLYTALVDKGYRVFYSRVSLKGKVSEQYEPYIYNAIKTAKVMIVYGEKAEYFNSTWIKNEWSRFKKRIEKGEKHKNSLVTLFKGVNPYDIPTALTGGKQAINYGLHSNYEVLLNHIKTVVDESSRLGTLETVRIEGGKIGKKSSEIKNKTLETREVGGRSGNVSVNDKQLLSLADTYIQEEEWDGATNALNRLIISNPGLIDARWGLLKIKFKAKDERALANCMDRFSKDDLFVLERVLNEIDKARATAILNSFYSACERLSVSKATKVIKLLLPFKSDGRKAWVGRMFTIAIQNDDFALFNLLLGGLESNEIDAYIEQNIKFARTTSLSDNKKTCLENVLSVEEGNIKALDMYWRILLEERKIQLASEKFKELLQYSPSVNDVIEQAIDGFARQIQIAEHVDFVIDIVKYYQGDAKALDDGLLNVAKTAQFRKFYEKARTIYEFILSIDENCAGAYWGICLIKAGVQDEYGLVTSPTVIKEEPEYEKYLTLVSPQRRSECIRLVKRQEERLAENLRIEEENRRKERERRQMEKAQRAQETADKVKVTIGVLAMILLPLIAGAVTTAIVFASFDTVVLYFIDFVRAAGIFAVGFYALEYLIYQTYFSENYYFSGWSKFLFILSSIVLAFFGLMLSSELASMDGIEFLIGLAWLIISIIVICRSEEKGTGQFIVVLGNLLLPCLIGWGLGLVFGGLAQSGIEIPEDFWIWVLVVILSLGGAAYLVWSAFFNDYDDLDELYGPILYGLIAGVFAVLGIGLVFLFEFGNNFLDLPIFLTIGFVLLCWYMLYKYYMESESSPVMITIMVALNIVAPMLFCFIYDNFLISMFA